MAFTADSDPEVKVLKSQMSQLMEMMTRSLGQVSQVAKVHTITTHRFGKEGEPLSIKSEIAAL